MLKLPETLRENVRLLGELLGETIHAHEGADLFAKVEGIRKLGKSITRTENGNSAPLVTLLGELGDERTWVVGHLVLRARHPQLALRPGLQASQAAIGQRNSAGAGEMRAVRLNLK